MPVESGSVIGSFTKCAFGASAVQSIVERYCGGSIERALVGLVDAGMVVSNQLALIIGRKAADRVVQCACP
jgi:hypothetical protein